MELGQKLKQARLAAGLSQRQLCGDTITRNMLSLIENGSAQPSMDTLRCLAQRLGKPISYFLEEPVLPPQQSRLADAWQALDDGQPETAWALASDPALSPSGQLQILRSCAALALAETAIREGRLPYAQKLLESIAADCANAPVLRSDLERRRLLLLFRCDPAEAVRLAGQLPEDEELLLHAAAALQGGDPGRCIALLDAAQPSERWYALRGDACFQLGQYEKAAQCYLSVEGRSLRQLEQCYEKLGDYQKAYYYACKQRTD